ncbi:hypothetical protein JCM19275_2575 [Nonlabens ulvanivorans]|uniref:Uncharacterized protein n=1 Tax=Nonlabens ulvanivorans TaxID=906888 RepID=A0A090WBX0_NONUL|nr:hypothetical protein JCM19275_2575 [Nonlabens ulvanivorans]
MQGEHLITSILSHLPASKALEIKNILLSKDNGKTKTA